MNFESFLPDLACPSCKGFFDWDETDTATSCGWLRCRSCLARTPVVEGIPFFNETEMDVRDARDLVRWRHELIGSTDEWEAYLAERQSRQTVDPYAAFAPFNEAHRAANPLLDLMAEAMPSGGAVVDLNNRTGWTGEYLAGRYPECRVFAIWEGNSSVLGYRGFLRLLAAEDRSSNLLPIFCPPTLPPPVQTQSAHLVHAHDCLHRRDQPRFLNDCLSLTHPEGMFIAPHVHLSNNQPSPFFERGGTLRHGREYRDWLRARLGNDPRGVRVFSEAGLFANEPRSRGKDEADTDHYNGLITVAPEAILRRLANEPVQAPDIQASWRCIPNPLLRVNPLTRKVAVDSKALGARSDYLLDRHPIYRQRLRDLHGLRIEPEDLLLINRFATGFTVAEAAVSIGKSVADVIARCRRMAAGELLMPTPINAGAVRLQDFHALAHSLIDRHVIRCWTEWVEAHPTRVYGTVLGESISRTEADELLRIVQSYVSRTGEPESIRMEAVTKPSPALMLVTLAFLASGARLAPLQEPANMQLREDPEGDIIIARDGQASVRLTEILSAFEADFTIPSATSHDETWWSVLDLNP